MIRRRDVGSKFAIAGQGIVGETGSMLPDERKRWMVKDNSKNNGDRARQQSSSSICSSCLNATHLQPLLDLPFNMFTVPFIAVPKSTAWSKKIPVPASFPRVKWQIIVE